MSNETQSANLTMQALIQLGGREWHSNDGTKNRVYFGDLSGFYSPLEIVFYNTGNISFAQLDGDVISNSRARRILDGLGSIKLWWDMDTQEFGFNADVWGEEAEIIVGEIKRRVAEIVGGVQ